MYEPGLDSWYNRPWNNEKNIFFLSTHYQRIGLICKTRPSYPLSLTKLPNYNWKVSRELYLTSFEGENTYRLCSLIQKWYLIKCFAIGKIKQHQVLRTLMTKLVLILSHLFTNDKSRNSLDTTVRSTFHSFASHSFSLSWLRRHCKHYYY